MEKLLASSPKALLTLQNGQEIEGQVIFITDREVILDLGYKTEGIIPKTQIPQEQLEKIKVGQRILAFVADSENEFGQVILSLTKPQLPQEGRKTFIDQKTQAQFWQNLAAKYSKDEIFKGTVTKIIQFGVFVKLEDPSEGGIEGLIHVSKLGPEDQFQVGQKISVTISSIDSQRMRLALLPVITSTKGLIYK